jgi:hypothetical protein
MGVHIVVHACFESAASTASAHDDKLAASGVRDVTASLLNALLPKLRVDSIGHIVGHHRDTDTLIKESRRCAVMSRSR